MKYLGIDYGAKKIGLAIGDGETKVAVPLELMQNNGEITGELIAKMVRDEEIDAVVVGVPGGEQAKVNRHFIKDLKKQVSVPVYEEDERFTSTESKRLQDEFGSGVSEDALSAMLLLQQYLNNLGREA